MLGLTRNTRKFLIFTICYLLVCIHCNDISAQEYINDGPYIFYRGDKLEVKWIKDNALRTKITDTADYKFFKRRFRNKHPYKFTNRNYTDTNYTELYKGINKFAAISDIHGQYRTFIKLLRKHKIVDRKLNWTFGNGHLIVLGDVMNRGQEVTKALWLIYKLEQQATKYGGKVHFLLGNHELMILKGNQKYLNQKYLKVSKILNTEYSDLFTKNSVLGNWIRNKPVMLKLNNFLFVHGGISKAFIEKKLSIAETNRLFREKIIALPWQDILADSTLEFLSGDKGILWYRSYFIKPLVPELCVEQTLNLFDVNYIIVGHTSLSNIVSIYNNKVLGIDSSIKLGNYGEILIFKNNKLFRGNLSGKNIEIK
ncbi:MAG: metallophosphoesterase [Bacteroidales bacterium]|nr:metallophosphoesterase [Bacteroidales bacterium]